MSVHRICFVSTNAAVAWGGSEVLWSEAAKRLVKSGSAVVASVHGWPNSAPEIAALRREGIIVNERWKTLTRLRPALLRTGAESVARRMSGSRLASWLDREKPDLICICLGSPADNIALMEACASSGIPYVTIIQANGECIWPDDARAEHLIRIVVGARQNFFVSKGNHTLFETQLGIAVPNAEVVRNPFNVRPEIELEWPIDSEQVRFACVGRLTPAAKGQDLLLRVIASEVWKERPISLSFFGKGESEQGLRRLTKTLGIENRVTFVGQVQNVESIWSTHHALVLPSRYEGLPLAVVEAMMCARPVIVTDVAGNREIVEDNVTGFLAAAPTETHLCNAMERAWARRSNWREIGSAASNAIRQVVPRDPAAEFSRKLLEVIDVQRSQTTPKRFYESPESTPVQVPVN